MASYGSCFCGGGVVLRALLLGRISISDPSPLLSFWLFARCFTQSAPDRGEEKTPPVLLKKHASGEEGGKNLLGVI